MAVLFVEALAQVVRGINLGQHAVTAFNASTFLQRAAYLGLVVLLRQVGRLALLPIAEAWFAAALFSVFLSGVWVWRRSAAAPLSWTALRTGWANGILRGLRGLVCVGLTLLLIRCDVYMLGPMLGIAVVGQVSVATYLAEWLWYVPSILNNLLFAASAADPRTRQVEQIARATRSLVALLVPACIVLMFAGKALVSVLYGSPYTEAGTLFVLLLPGATALALHLVVDSYFAGKGFPAITIWAPGLALALKVALNLVVVPRYGVVGAVCISSLLYMGLLTIKVVALVREVKVPWSVLLRPTWRDVTTSLGSATTWVFRRA
jgi:O-antigen/teichoic acid export membrane protein